MSTTSPLMLFVATFSPAIGKAISLAETRDVEIRNFRARGVRRFAALEAGSEARLVGGLFENTGVPATGASYGTDCIVFGVSAARSSRCVISRSPVTAATC